MRHRARGDEIGTQPVEGDDNEAHAPHCSWIARDGRVPTGIQGGLHSGRLRHDGNSVLGWCVGNVVGQEDRRGNLFPTKQRDGKIDAAVALLMAIGRAQAASGDGAEDITAFLLNPVMG